MTCDETDGSVILSTNNNAVTIYTHLAGSTHNGSGSPGRRRDPGSRTNHKFDSCRVAPAATRLSALLPLDRPAPPRFTWAVSPWTGRSAYPTTGVFFLPHP